MKYYQNISSRRRFLSNTAKVALLGAVSPALFAKPEDQAKAMAEAFGDSPIKEGRIKITMPSLAENGNSVRMSFTVESPMTIDDYVESVHIFSEANPIATIASYFFTPESGKAEIQTRIRLNDTQNITAVAQMSDGSLWMDSTHIDVTIAACVNPWL